MPNVTDKDQVAIGTRVVIETDNGEKKATIFGFPFKTKNFVSALYDGDTKPINIDLDIYGAFVRTTRGRRPISANSLPGATLLIDHQAAQQATKTTVSKKQSSVAASVAKVAPRAVVKQAAAPVASKKGAGTGIANSGSGKLMKIGGSKAYALAKNPSEEGLTDLLATIESGFRTEFGIGKRVNSRKPREVAAVAPVATRQPRKVAAPAPVAKVAPRAVAMPTVNRRPSAPMS